MAAGTIEKIQIILQSLTDGFARGLNRAQAQLKTVGKNMQGFGKVMSAPMEKFKMMNSNMKEMNTVGGRLAFGIRNLTHGMRGFRMEALGVMFFGMMLQRTFTSLLQPVMDAYGIFDIFRLMLLTLFLPVMDMLFPYLLAVMEWFMNLPESVQKAIGIFVVLGAIFGTLLMLIGTFSLGIGSLIQYFPILGGAIKAVGIFLAGMGTTALIVIAAIIAVVVGMYIAWKENFMGMKQIVSNILEGIKTMFGGAFDVLKGIINFFVSLFKGDWEGVKASVIQILNGLLSFIKGFIDTAINSLAAIGIGVIRIFKGVVTVIKDALLEVINWFWDKFNNLTFGIAGKITGGLNSKKVDDFILQPGGRLIETNPNDTIIGYKGSSPGVGGQQININPVYNITVSDRNELERAMRDNNIKLVEELKRLK